MVDGSGLENRRAKASWVRIPPSPPRDTGRPAPTYCVLGCLALDIVVGASGDLIRRACGGNALYAVAGAHLWDVSVGLVARVGRDYPRGCLR